MLPSIKLQGNPWLYSQVRVFAKVSIALNPMMKLMHKYKLA
jgi:hypothetical protein